MRKKKANGRVKGQAGEAEVVKLFREYGDKKARRGIQGASRSGEVVADVEQTLFPELHVEVKRVEQFNMYNALDQADHDRPSDKYPAIFHRKNRRQMVVVMYATDFMDLFAKEKD